MLLQPKPTRARALPFRVAELEAEAGEIFAQCTGLLGQAAYGLVELFDRVLVAMSSFLDPRQELHSAGAVLVLALN